MNKYLEIMTFEDKIGINNSFPNNYEEFINILRETSYNGIINGVFGCASNRNNMIATCDMDIDGGHAWTLTGLSVDETGVDIVTYRNPNNANTDLTMPAKNLFEILINSSDKKLYLSNLCLIMPQSEEPQ